MGKKSFKEDFYEAVNGDFIEKAVIPDDRTSIGGFQDLVIGIEKLLINDFDKALKYIENTKNGIEDKENELIYKSMKNNEMDNFLKYYGMIKNKEKLTKEENKKNYEILKKLANKILELKDYNDLNEKMYELIYMGVNFPFSFGVTPDLKNAIMNTFEIDVPDLILPDKDYYTEKNEKSDELIKIYKETVKNVLTHLGYLEEFSNDIIKKTISFDKRLYPNMKNSRERADYVALYNKRTMNEVKKYSDFIDFSRFTEFVKQDIKEIIVTEPLYFEHLNEVVNLETFDELKAWLFVGFITSYTSLFDEELREIGAKYSLSLQGTKKIMEFDKFVYYKSQSAFSQVVGNYYGEKYFGKKAKEDVKTMVENLIDVYKKRLNENKWLSKKTIEKAIEKLDSMGIMVGYPDNYPEYYKKINIDENLSIFENFLNIMKIKFDNAFEKYNKKVDKTLWHMPANMVNAYFDPTANLICFPAAILQKPFYNINQTKSENYGGIGVVIGHEISHAFDNNGAKFDKYGNINNWWQEIDFEEFKKYQEKMINQFDGLKIGKSTIKGVLTVSENIADCGGLACSNEALKLEKDYNLEEFFINYAKIWCTKMREEYIDLLANTDVHAPNKLRVNVQIKNLDDFYKTFNINENDEMFLKKEDRITIW